MTKYNSEKDLSLDQILSSIKKIILEEKPVNEQTKPLELNEEKFNKKENKEKEAKDQEGDILDLTEVVNIGLQNQKSFVGDINCENNQNDSVVEITTSTPTISEKIDESPVEKRIQHIFKNLQENETKIFEKITKEDKNQVEQIIINCAQIIIKEYLDEKLLGVIEKIKKIELNKTPPFDP